jgi:hypothetical protein
LKKICEIIALNYRLDKKEGPPTHFYFLKSPLEKFTNFKCEVLLYKMGSPAFIVVAVTRMQIFRRISILHSTLSIQHNHGCNSTRTLACRIPVLSDIRFVDWGHRAQLRHAYRIKSKTLLNPANQVDPFDTVKTDSSKIVAFLEAILKNLNMLTDLSLDL